MEPTARACNVSSAATAASRAAVVGTGLKPAIGAWVGLFKLRVVALLLLSSIGGALLASHGRLSAGNLALLLLSGTLSSAGASALNQYLERDQDARMQRTRRRPLVAGRIAPSPVLAVSVTMVILAIAIALPFNRLLTLFLALGVLVYVGIYTLWLKPRTPLNIVIGGAAGSCAVLSGSAVAGNWAHPTAVGLALLVFFWTPLHFWSLAQAYRDDYACVGVPMLPVLVSDRASAWGITLHASATALSALLLSVDPALGGPYLLVTGLATLWLGWHSVRLISTPGRTQALKLFRVSNLYLGLVLLAIYAGTLSSSQP